MRKIDGLSLEDLKLGVKVVIILTLISIPFNYFIYQGISWDSIKYSILYNFYYGFSLSVVNGVFFSNIDKWIGWEDKPKYRLWVGIMGSITITMVTLFILNFILWVVFWGNEFEVLFSDRNRKFYIYALVITVVVASVLHATEFFKEIQASAIREEKLRKEKIASELNALKAQIDPHFLFNSFNTLSGLIDEDPTKAKNILKQISDVYRYILDNRTEDTNPVSAELEFSKKYFDIQKARFEDSIELNIDVDKNSLHKKLPSLSLQLLLENAIKHNGFSPSEPLTISIKNDNGFIVVHNNKKLRKNLHEGSKLGLQNISERYSLMNISDFEVTDETNYFEVKLPML